MRTLLSMAMLCLVVVGCTTVPRDFQDVWMKKTPPPADLAAPTGFTVTSSKAYSLVIDSRALSLKHVRHIYVTFKCMMLFSATVIAKRLPREYGLTGRRERLGDNDYMVQPGG